MFTIAFDGLWVRSEFAEILLLWLGIQHICVVCYGFWYTNQFQYLNIYVFDPKRGTKISLVADFTISEFKILPDPAVPLLGEFTIDLHTEVHQKICAEGVLLEYCM